MKDLIKKREEDRSQSDLVLLLKTASRQILEYLTTPDWIRVFSLDF